jgi:hypothetical protein
LFTEQNHSYREEEGRALAKYTIRSLLRRLSKAGFSPEFIRRGILPDWWSSSCDEDPALIGDIEFRIARFLGMSVDVLRDSQAVLRPPFPVGARLRRVKNSDANQFVPAIHAGVRIAEAVVRSLREPDCPIRPPPLDSRSWWEELRLANGSADLASLAADLWARGIPVVHVEMLPPPKYQGMVCVVSHRPVVVLGRAHDEPPRLAFFIAHEAGHLVFGDCIETQPIVDAEDNVPDDSDIETRADAYASAALCGGQAIPNFDTTDWREVANCAAAFEAAHGVDAGTVVWSWAARTQHFLEGQMALKALYRSQGGQRILRDLFERHVNVEAASETDLDLLGCVSGGVQRDAPAS